MAMYLQNEHIKPIRLIILDLGEKKIFFFKITFIMFSTMQLLTHHIP